MEAPGNGLLRIYRIYIILFDLHNYCQIAQ